MAATEGQTQCFDAFVVALGQACKGGKKRWYASTLELQLASLDICRACRSVSSLHVRVRNQTPRSLWSPRKVQMRPDKNSSKIRIASRVPVVRALRLTWSLPMEDLLRRAAIELWTSTECLELLGSLYAAKLGSVVWPRGLTQLVLDRSCDIPIHEVSWPMRLQRLALGNFNQPIAGVVWPASLQDLSFWSDFNQPCRSRVACIPATAIFLVRFQSAYWGSRVAGVPTTAILRNGFNQPIARVEWPTSLKRLSLGRQFNQPLAGVAWPTSLRRLSLGREFNQPLAGVVWPTSLQRLSFGSSFNQPVVGVVWPVSLQELSFGERFNQPIAGVVWPVSLEELYFGSQFNQPLAGVAWPTSLRCVNRFGESLL